MAKYEWSEVFMSIEGEARYAGHPTAYIRFARCNFQCAMFNNSNKEVEKDGYAVLGFKPTDYTTLQSIPLITKGCDSQYAVNPAFAHMWHKGDEQVLADELVKVLPTSSFNTPRGKPVILSLTGGEPTIRLKFWIPLLEKTYQLGMRHVLIETNCAAPLRQTDVDTLYDWLLKKPAMRLTWSNSPKISVSGEKWEDAIRPEIATRQRTYKTSDITAYWHAIDQYFKFVCDPSKNHFEEVAMAMEEYYKAGIPRDVEVYIMPTACTEEQQQDVAAKVAAMCMQYGWIYCHRLQSSLWGNGVGT